MKDIAELHGNLGGFTTAYGTQDDVSYAPDYCKRDADQTFRSDFRSANVHELVGHLDQYLELSVSPLLLWSEKELRGAGKLFNLRCPEFVVVRPSTIRRLINLTAYGLSDRLPGHDQLL